MDAKQPFSFQRISDLNSIFADWNDGRPLVQDMFKLSSDDKWEAFSYVLNSASEKGTVFGNKNC